MQYKAFIGIGSNLGTPAENCEQAIHLLHIPPEIEVVARSSLYESEPVGEIEQNWFVNATVAIKTSLTPEALLNTIFKIEKNNIHPTNFPGSSFKNVDFRNWTHGTVDFSSKISNIIQSNCNRRCYRQYGWSYPVRFWHDRSVIFF